MPDLSKVYRCPVTGRFYDPLRVRRDLLSRDFNKLVADRAANEGDLVTVGRAALGLSEIDAETGAGWTDAAVLDALTSFTEYLAGKDETAQNSPTSAPCTDCP